MPPIVPRGTLFWYGGQYSLDLHSLFQWHIEPMALIRGGITFHLQADMIIAFFFGLVNDSFDLGYMVLAHGRSPL